MTENHDHYFTESPSTEFRSREISVELAGRNVTVETAGGVFSPDHIDTGTSILLECAGELPAQGTFLDLGCGWGPIALAMALSSPDATVWALDVNERSRALTSRNADRLGLNNIRVAHPDEVPADVAFDVIWSNPPIRVGKAVLHDLLSLWLSRLRDGGEAWLVVAKNLGAPSLLGWLRERFASGMTIDRVAQDKGFHVIRLRRAADGS